MKTILNKNLDLKNQFRVQKIKDPKGISEAEAALKYYLDSLLNDPFIVKNTIHFYFKNKNLDKFRFVKVTSYPDVRKHLTANKNFDELLLTTQMNHH